MRSATTWKWAVRGIAALAVAAGCLTCAQYAPTGNPRIDGQPGRRNANDGSDVDPAIAERRIRALNTERHKAMVSDTEKLVKLARELDEEVASSPSGNLTPEELHKVAVIEKLARDVKSKMAQSFGDNPELRPPAFPSGGPGAP